MGLQAPPKDLRIGLSQLHVTDEDTEAQRGAVTCPGSHSREVVERLALFQPPRALHQWGMGVVAVVPSG